MTDAIAINNTVICNDDISESNAAIDAKETEDTDTSCDVTNTSSFDGIVVDNATAKVNENSTSQFNNDSIGTEKCVNNANATDICAKEETKTEPKNSDTVLKYVYKKSDKSDKLVAEKKTKGHSANSIVRRKRSLEVEPAYDIKSISPAPAEYDGKGREELALPRYKSGNIINKSNLANFNIKTLHEDSNLSAKPGKEKKYVKPTTNKYFKDNVRRHEPLEYDKVEELDNTRTKSTENDSRENNEGNENIENKRRYSPYFIEKENINESTENSDEPINTKKYKDIERINIASKYISNINDRKENYEHDKVSPYAKDPPYKDVSVENSSESDVYGNSKSDKTNESYEEKPANTNTPRSLQDVDLGDFSYETIQVNDKGQVEPTKDLHENDNSDDIKQTSNTQPISKTEKNKLEPFTISVEPTSDDFNASNEQPININDGEVKPVVELNNEDDSTESSEESSVEQRNSHLKKSEEGNNSSKEGQINNKDVNEKIVELKAKDGDKVNVKQQVERIPLDYNHDDKSQQKESGNADQTETLKVSQDEKNNDGTLDSLTPKTDTYDDNLNIKFDDVAISLPDIYLPDDILSYSRIGAPKKKKNKKKNKEFYHYDDDDSEENQDEQKEDIKNADKSDNPYTYDSYIDKDHENYKISNDEDDDGAVDLYEKFVRERFGKKGSFGKRSEKLQAEERKPSNPKLHKTIQTLLKQTEKVRDEAEKSGDPNAGYMWTLEYGENH